MVMETALFFAVPHSFAANRIQFASKMLSRSRRGEKRDGIPAVPFEPSGKFEFEQGRLDDPDG